MLRAYLHSHRPSLAYRRGVQNLTSALHLCFHPRSLTAAVRALSSPQTLAQGADDALGDLADAQIAAKGL